MKSGQYILVIFNTGIGNRSDNGIYFRPLLVIKLPGYFLFDFNIPDRSLRDIIIWRYFGMIKKIKYVIFILIHSFMERMHLLHAFGYFGLQQVQ